MTNLDLIELYRNYEIMPTKEFVELFNNLTVDNRKELLSYINDLPNEKIYKDFVKDIRGQAVKNFWNHERELILGGKSTQNWTPEQIECIMNINPNRIAADLTAIYNSANHIRLAEFSVAVSEHFLKIAGVEFPLNQLKNRLSNEYKCYLDKGSVPVKLGKLQNAINIGLERLRNYSQTVPELKITARKLCDIADHALRLAIEEALVQRAEQKETSEESPLGRPVPDGD